MSIKPEQIKHIAMLSRLSLSDKEIAMYSSQLSQIFSYVEQLNEVNTDDVPETTQVTGLKNVFVEDEPVQIDDQMRQKLLQQFPDRNGDLLRVQQVLDKK